MPGKYSFRIRTAAGGQRLPERLVVGRNDFESPEDVVLKGLSYLLFYRERLQVDVNLHMDSIPYRPDLVQQDYELRVTLWVECGECPIKQLDKLAVKAPEAAIWVVKRSEEEADELVRLMAKAGLRRHRYHVVGLEGGMVEEITAGLRPRNDLFWVKGSFDPPELQFDFNGLWFDSSFKRLDF